VRGIIFDHPVGFEVPGELKLAKARSAKSSLRVVFLNAMLISLREVIKMGGT